jgi:4-hydroxy-2-oxovalerate aldolase
VIAGGVDILETTLRDGNYVVDFQLTAEDTARLARELEQCGIRWIEVGHGLGLGASAVHGKAAARDDEYIRAAREAVRNAKIGVFAIPGVAQHDDIAMAADLGLDFVRVGADLERIDEMAPFVEAVRRRGLFACTNFMKSYTTPPDAFAEICARAESFGTQMNYLVDSAGGMLPDEVGTYLDAMLAETDVPFGFHGHDNTRLAVANTLVAVERGAMLVDTTLYGIGRGSGNAATELIAALVQRRHGRFERMDAQGLVRLAEREAVPLLASRDEGTLSISLGLAKVHSMYLDTILAWAAEHDLEPHALIAAIGEIDNLRVDDAILAQASRRVSKRR